MNSTNPSILASCARCGQSIRDEAVQVSEITFTEFISFIYFLLIPIYLFFSIYMFHLCFLLI